MRSSCVFFSGRSEPLLFRSLTNTERMLKKAILHRKNTLFYKAMNGARAAPFQPPAIQLGCGDLFGILQGARA